jgi:hypothetical protein
MARKLSSPEDQLERLEAGLERLLRFASHDSIDSFVFFPVMSRRHELRNLCTNENLVTTALPPRKLWK